MDPVETTKTPAEELPPRYIWKPEDFKRAMEVQNSFTDKLNALIDTFRTPDGCMPLGTLATIQGVLIRVSGYLEGTIKLNQEMLLGRDLPRLDMEVLYAAYTDGFNQAALKMVEHADEIAATLAERKLKAMAMKVQPAEPASKSE